MTGRRTPSPVWTLAVATGLLVGAFTWAAAHRVDTNEHDRYQERLGRLVTLQHRLNEQVLRAHAGLVGSYDPLVRTTLELRAIHRELAEPPSFVSAEGAADVRAHLERSGEIFRTQEERVERFKSRNAVLLNSLRYFPVAASELARAMGDEPASSETAAQLREALRDVLRVAVFPRAAAVEEAAAHLRSIEPIGPHAGDVRLILRHAEIITTERPGVDALLAEILEQPGAQSASALSESYARWHTAALASEERALLLLLLSIVIGVVLVAASLLLRLREDSRRIETASKRLAQSIDRQNRFVSMTSHEFRTPLSVIVSSADLLLSYGERWTPEQHRKHVAKIERAGRAMTDLLDGMLLIGRTDAGHRDFRPARVELAPLLADVADNQRSRAREGVTIEVTLQNVGDAVLADPRLLRHALDNLIGNAVKYSRPQGVVRVRVERTPETLAVHVSDDGIGIPTADQGGLFEPFPGGGNGGMVPGTGLGLAVVKRAVDLHGGTITVTSTEGSGTQFEVRIPVASADAGAHESGSANADAPAPAGPEVAGRDAIPEIEGS